MGGACLCGSDGCLCGGCSSVGCMVRGRREGHACLCGVWKCLWMPGGCAAVGAGVQWDGGGGVGGVGKGVCRGCVGCGRVEWRCVCIGCLYAWCVWGWHVWVGCVRLCGGAICGVGGWHACLCGCVAVCAGVMWGGIGAYVCVCVVGGGGAGVVCGCVERLGGGGDVHVWGVRIGVVGASSFVSAAYV